MVKDAKKKIKGLRKKWVKIFAPEIFDQQFLGETYVAEPKLILGKTITVNLMSLTGDPKKQNVYVSFLVTGMKKEGGSSEFYRYKLSESAVKRLARRGKDKVLDSFEIHTLDKKLLRIKPLMITKSRVSKPTQADLRRKVRELVASNSIKLNLDKLASDIISKKLQRDLSDALRKITPLVMCEIKDFYILPSSRTKVTAQ